MYAYSITCLLSILVTLYIFVASVNVAVAGEVETDLDKAQGEKMRFIGSVNYSETIFKQPISQKVPPPTDEEEYNSRCEGKCLACLTTPVYLCGTAMAVRYGCIATDTAVKAAAGACAGIFGSNASAFALSGYQSCYAEIEEKSFCEEIAKPCCYGFLPSQLASAALAIFGCGALAPPVGAGVGLCGPVLKELYSKNRRSCIGNSCNNSTCQ